MRDVFEDGHAPSEPDPVKRAQNAMARQVLPKRFYAEVSVAEEDGRFALKLDGRGARTPGRKPLSMPTHMAASIVANEWRAQKDVINPDAMPATRIVNTALDGVADMMPDVAAEIAGYVASDLVCYRAGEPMGLANLQTVHWDPVLAWVKQEFGASFVLAEGVMPVAQSPQAVAPIADAVTEIKDPIVMACLHVLTTLSGSCLIALMAARGGLSGEAAWDAATVDESWSILQWGQDDEAAARQERRKQDFITALGLLRSIAWHA
jgi:chaperone required for assembly of F1-ATPase